MKAKAKAVSITMVTLAILTITYAVLDFKITRWFNSSTHDESVWKGLNPPGDGYYIQVQAWVLENHALSIIDHVKSFGYQRFWLMPMKRNKDVFILRLGPFPDSKQAKAERNRFVELMKKSPPSRQGLRNLKWDDSFIVNRN